MREKSIFLLCVASGIFLSCCPFFLSAYWLRILTNIYMFAIVAEALNIIAGYTGYPAFGNVVFFGLGAYSTGVLMVKYHIPFPLTLLAGIGVCLLFTLLFGLPVLRLKGHYFAIATLGLNEATKAITDNLTGLTGGGMGLSIPLPGGNVASNTRFFYFLFLGTMALVVLVTYFLSRIRFGYACRSIRADEDVAKSMGINTTRIKTLAWMISAGFTGIAGSAYAYWMSYIEPSAVFNMTISIKAFVMFLLGGSGTIVGPIAGAFFVELASIFAWSHLLNYHVGTLGLIVILIVLFMPRGFVPFVRQKLSLPARTKDVKRGKGSWPVRQDIKTPSGLLQQGEILSLHCLASGYNGLQVLWDIDLSLKKGEWLAILGPNHAGKSTLLKTIAGLIQPFRGQVLYQGTPIHAWPVHRRVTAGISLAPEGRRLFAGMTVRENLMMGAFTRDAPAETRIRLQSVFSLFPVLKEREDQIVGTLSGGERQMCAIGRALMCQPNLLLVDEMSLGLAPVVIDALLEALVTIRKEEGMTLMVVEQDVYAALVYADRGYILREGRIVKSGNSNYLLQDPSIQKDYLGYGT
ncbi:MAG: branched-chain amino acid transport system permease protein [Thermodesulfobacteriota bacterium]|nr:branched-chain amino acid transport system permease protein [Thermodesulfobacteriota bacterium]